MKHYYFLAVFVTIWALFGTVSCQTAAMQIKNPAVQAQILGNLEKDLLAGGGALLISGGSGSAAVAAMTAQEVKNIPELQKVLASATPATVTQPAASGSVEAPALPAVVISGK